MTRQLGWPPRRPNLPTPVAIALGVGSLAVAAVVLGTAADGEALAEAGRALVAAPGWVAVALAAFGCAFVLRAVVWVRVLPDLRFRHALAALHLALGANHLLPLRLGEPVRVLSVVRRSAIPVDAATASTLSLRSADIVAMVVVGALVGPAAFARLVGPWGWTVVAVAALVGAAGTLWLARLRRRPGGSRIRLPGPVVALGALAAWLAEAVLVWQSARFAGIELSVQDALWVTAVAVTAQVVAIAPGGLGTYEAAAVAAYAVLGVDTGAALAAAIVAHALKTAYSLVAGGIAVVCPRPGLLGRLRLPAEAPPRSPAPPVDGSVVLVLPAHDEEGTVAAVVSRTPATVCGRPVEVVVVDDGSSDGTAHRAARAGARVIRHETNRGLGAAVRTGLDDAVARGAAVVAFCDADGEYDPAQLERLVAPILAGEADYVVGSRFAGRIRSMRPHRRLGNVVLTHLLAIVSRQRITDGQSGFRALSRRAADEGEILHDYNYAQVLTLDLLARGFRYHEVPIDYAFRRTGRSFVTLGRYLRHVLPAVHRVLNRDPGSVLDHVGAEPVAGPAPGLGVEVAVIGEGGGGRLAHDQRMVGVVGGEQP